MTTQLDPRTDFAVTLAPQMNLMTNAGFEVWQRGTSFSNPASVTYTADKWLVYTPGGSPTLTISRDGSIVDSEAYSMQVNCTAVGGITTLMMYQTIDNLTALYAGQTMSLSIRVKTTIAGKIRARILDSAGGANTSFSQYHTGSGNWETLTVTRTIGSSGFSNIAVGMIAPDVVVTGQWWLDSAMLIFGSNPMNYIPMHPADNLSRCLRYCQKFGGGAINQDIAIGIALSTSACEFPIHYFVPMAAVPTATVFSSTNWKTGNPAGGLVGIGATAFGAETNHSGYFSGSSVSGSPLTAFHAAELFSSTISEYLLLEVL